MRIVSTRQTAGWNMSDQTCLRLERDGAIAHLRMVQPDRANAMTISFWHELPRLLVECRQDPTVRVLVISGDGKNFCSGMHLDVFRGMERGRDTIEGARWRANFRNGLLAAQDAFNGLESAQFPVIAAIQGACLGAAVDLICACDVRYAAEDAFFVIAETNIGIMPDAGTVPRMSKLMPDGIVRELVFSGRRMPAQEAARWGFVNRVLPDAAAALESAMVLARDIAAKSPNAIAGSKEMLNYGRDHTVADTLRHVAALQAATISFDDVELAIQAQRAKQEAAFADLYRTDGLF
jgi:enoyl-CoA hydratase